MARPMPRLAPVTRATFPSRVMARSSWLSCGFRATRPAFAASYRHSAPAASPGSATRLPFDHLRVVGPGARGDVLVDGRRPAEVRARAAAIPGPAGPRAGDP